MKAVFPSELKMVTPLVKARPASGEAVERLSFVVAPMLYIN